MKPHCNRTPVEHDVRPIAWICLRTEFYTMCERAMRQWESQGYKMTPLYAIPEDWILIPKEPTVDASLAECGSNPQPLPGKPNG